MDIPIHNIYYLLSYAWDMLDEDDLRSVGKIDNKNFQNLYGRALVGGASNLLRRGLDRGYIEHREDTRTIRGKINLTPTIKKNLLRDAKVDCSFDELSYNVLHNRILKSTIKTLMNAEDLDKSIREELSLSYRKLEAIEEIELRKNLFRRLQFSRNNSIYSILMNWCELIVDELLVNEQDGTHTFKDFFRDSKMQNLFERFVGNFYKKHRDEHHFTVGMQRHIKWDGIPLDKVSEEYLPIMKADAVLESPDKTIVLDTKYSKQTLSKGQFGKLRIKSTHLYQIFSYIKNLEVLGGLNETCEGILLYPTIDASFPGADYEIQGHKVSVRTINLNQEWRGIHKELISLVSA